MKRLLTVLMILILTSLMIAPLSLAQGEDGYIRYPITADPEHLNPFIADTITIGTVNRNVFEGLVYLNAETGEIEPAIAESWEVGEDEDGNQTFTFNIRQGVLFHQIEGIEYAEGEREVTANDVLWNYMVSLNPDEDISIRSGEAAMQSILGASEYVAAMEEMLEAGEEIPLINEELEVPGLEVLDDYTFRITLSQPNRLFIYNGNISIVSPAAYAQLGDDISNTPVGTGPYQFVEWRRQDTLVLEANPEYYVEGMPMNAGIRFINYGDANTALLDYREGNLDFLFSFPSGQRQAIIDEFGTEFNEKPGLHIRYWGFNMETGFLSEQPLVRQAFAHALDRVTAWDILAEGARFPADLGFLPPSFPASTPSTTYPYDLELAAQLLEEAGFPGGEGLPVIKIHLLEVISDEAQVVVWQQGLESLGVEVEFIVEDGGTYWDSIVQDDAMIFQNGWAAGIPDPSDVFDYLIYEGSGSMRYDNPEVNDLLDQARAELDEAVRTDLYQQAHDIIMEDAVVIPSAYSKVSWLQKPYVDGFAPGGGGTYTAPMWKVALGDM